MKKRLIAALLTAGLLFSFGTTAFADVPDEQMLDTDRADSIVTQDNTVGDGGVVVPDDDAQPTLYTITYVDGNGKTLWTDTYSDEIKVRDDIPEREGFIFDKWKDEVNDKTYKKGNTIFKKTITLTAQWEAKTGHFGYYLSDPAAEWVKKPDGLTEYQDKDKTKYLVNTPVAHGDKTTVTNEIPVLKDHVFLGWGDKERKDTGPNQPPAIRKGGDTITYYYENEEKYTLDALWGSLSIKGDEKTYDGNRFALTPAVLTLNDNGLKEELSKEYYSQLTNLVTEYSYSKNHGTQSAWTTDLDTISFTDVGTYTLYVKITVTGSVGQPLEANADYIIKPRKVTLTSGSATKEYDGTPLTNSDITVSGDDFANGEGATYNVTGTVTGTPTEGGSAVNEFTYALNGNTKSENYEITQVRGKLTVTPQKSSNPDDTKPNPGTTPTPAPVVTPAPTTAPSTDSTTPTATATPAPTATAVPTATPAAAPAATTIPQTGDSFPAVALLIVMLAAILGLGITIILRAGKKK